MDPIDLTLQLLSVLFTAVGIIVAVGAMDTRWSLAVVIYRCVKGRSMWSSSLDKP